VKKSPFSSITDDEFKRVCHQSLSMSRAAARLGLHFNTFKRRAIQLGCYKPNQAGRGLRKNAPKVPIEDIIFHGKHPQYQSYKLKKRLFEEGLVKRECQSCGLTEWRGGFLPLELHHIDGNRTNHHVSNLMILCPNCHSQTDTFRARNKGK
jgi:5-methylcytosine-specific restriction endonuclease McrA